MKHQQNIGRSAAILTAAALTVTSLPVLAVSSAEYNTWTGYVLRNTEGKYLSVAGGTEAEGISVDFFEADGAAAYNTWYFTETDFGITIKSALSEGQYYLAEGGNGSLFLSTTPDTFDLSADGILSGFRSGVENPVYAQVTPEAVTNLRAGDMNQDGVLDGMDLAILRQLVTGNADFVQTGIGDLNGDGTLSGSDVSLLQRYLLGEPLTFPVPQIPQCSQTPPLPEPIITETTPIETTAPTETTTTTESTILTTESTVAETTSVTTTTTTTPEFTMADFPAEYQYAADWIWDNRIAVEKSTERRNTIFDQIVAGKGTINYVVRWQSYKTVTLEQRQQFEQLVSDSINDWAKWLSGWDGWEYDNIEVNIVGWAVLDKSVLLDLQPDEVVYDDLIEPYDSTYDTSNGVETIPDKLPSAPSELSRFDHFADSSYEYPGGLDARFDMYLWATQGFPSIGGCGGDWGQRLSDDAYLNMLDGTGLHVLEHEIGHGFGMTDFYGGEGEYNGFPPGGFPGGENSLMMAGSSMKITDFDGWMLRYMWSKIKDEEGRF
ncbi:dockerin type I repeat-containing protein [uncultured Ruminococcus sp.]|uniref:dockerin type I repeat-containing protein n=1 Tax=uncultured Ruminococcus sp. TaxID=165186 RepID=UPI00261438BC|nr:dockerin type I repeat-containing protein [uncultured Ruminococcus sp.]